MKKIFLIGGFLMGMGASVYAKTWGERWENAKAHVARHKEKYVTAATLGFGLAKKIYSTKKNSEGEQTPEDNELEINKLFKNDTPVWSMPEGVAEHGDDDLEINDETKKEENTLAGEEQSSLEER